MRELSAGVTVGIVAMPLAMAFAIASGLTPERGLYTAVIAGFLISVLGGSRVQISGPTGAFVVVIFGVVQRHGYEGLVIATLIAGIILIVSGLSRFGRFVKYIPYPVTTGFTTGIATIIFSTQINEFFGLHIKQLPADFAQKWVVYFENITQFHPETFLVGLGSLALILIARRFSNRIPGPLLAVLVSSVAVAVFHLNVETIGDHFGVISAGLPGLNSTAIVESLNMTTIRQLLPDAFTIAFLAGVESLLSAVVADGMSGTHHDSDTELTATGIANIASVLFGGIPATGAIARTATNIKNGAKTPLAGVFHSLTVLAFTLILAPYASAIPLAALAAILFVVAFHMSEINHFIHMFRAPKSDAAVMLLVFLLTVFVDLAMAVGVGVALSAILFMKRMSEMTDVLSAVKLIDDDSEVEPLEADRLAKKDIPDGAMVYEIQGPFFFGVADKLKGTLDGLEMPPRVVILRMRKVPVIDATGVYALIEFHQKCNHSKSILILSGVSLTVHRILEKMGVVALVGNENVASHIDKALERARHCLKD